MVRARSITIFYTSYTLAYMLYASQTTFLQSLAQRDVEIPEHIDVSGSPGH